MQNRTSLRGGAAGRRDRKKGRYDPKDSKKGAHR